jgi:hypothetical protein
MISERSKLVEHFDKDTELKSKMLISGIQKICVLGTIKYHQIKQEMFEEVSYHPEVLKGFEILHYHVDHNLPIEKELVFKLVPELFVHEINKLGAKDRERFKARRIGYERADGEKLEIDEVATIEGNTLNDREKMFDKAMQMEMYLLEQTSDVFHMYSKQMADEITTGGHANLTGYLMTLFVMKEDVMKPWERRMMDEIKQLRMIEEDIEAIRLLIAEQDEKVVVPYFIQDP